MDLAVMKETGRGFSGRCANQYLRPSVLATVFLLLVQNFYKRGCTGVPRTSGSTVAESFV